MRKRQIREVFNNVWWSKHASKCFNSRRKLFRTLLILRDRAHHDELSESFVVCDYIKNRFTWIISSASDLRDRRRNFKVKERKYFVFAIYHFDIRYLMLACFLIESHVSLIIFDLHARYQVFYHLHWFMLLRVLSSFDVCMLRFCYFRLNRTAMQRRRIRCLLILMQISTTLLLQSFASQFNNRFCATYSQNLRRLKNWIVSESSSETVVWSYWTVKRWKSRKVDDREDFELWMSANWSTWFSTRFSYHVSSREYSCLDSSWLIDCC